MLIYVIPFILLLVVAIVLKKREASKEAEPKTQKVVAAKNKAKKTSSSKKSPQQTQVVEDVVAKKATTPLATDLRNKIEGQIRDRNFFSAEAQINQALNKDNSQHELYLLLLDIHLLQKDEFAISQLLNHLRSLELDDILAQAEAKKSDYDQLHQNSRDTIEFKPTEIAPSAPKPVEATNTADFDALMSSNNPAPAPVQASVQASVVEPVQDIKPLDFDTSAFTTTTTAQPEPSIEVQSLDFDISSLNTPTAEPAKPAEELKPLDFGSLSLESTPAQPAETAAADIQPLNFSFNLDTAPTTTPEAEISPPAVDERPEFTFDFSSESTAEAAKDIPAFSFDTVSPSEAIIEEKPAVVTPSLSFSLESTAPANTTDQSDPLVQSFPQLNEVNEIHLNLELAEQYIQLGAFEAAREILVEQEPNYSTEQRQQVEQLLSRIAS